MRHPPAWVAAIGHARVTHAAAPTEVGHPALYETCAAVVIAVLVVLYFDEGVRRDLSLRARGRAIGYLGGIIAIGILTPVLVLAGFVKDSTGARVATVGFAALFLIGAFGLAASKWGREDGAKVRTTAPARPAVPSVPVPRGAVTERERAAELLAAALFILGMAQPAAVMAAIERSGPTVEVERLRLLNDQWIALQPSLIAVTAWYPSAEVRECSARFVKAGHEAMKQTAILFANKETLINGTSRDQWQREAEAAYETVDAEWNAFVGALNPVRGAGNGRRPSAGVKAQGGAS